ncbi:hypothetical protein CBR_g29473 [Chara braunii]|uniref:BZIP domain-containing protein n=1 Tax=Chara braunii TaxID=69332 RepID=A0A388LAW5_CHABU|nr:hypothetical protein CBR_g29473 [Chara braunii]|eukprot:GBG79323.1 hypothetical protein CBR_g29473 [Chara braunii]
MRRKRRTATRKKRRSRRKRGRRRSAAMDEEEKVEDEEEEEEEEEGEQKEVDGEEEEEEEEVEGKEEDEEEDEEEDGEEEEEEKEEEEERDERDMEEGGGGYALVRGLEHVLGRGRWRAISAMSNSHNVLVAFHALEAASFARSLARVAKCENDMVAYSILTPLSEFLSALRECFADVTRGLRASDNLQTVHTRQWKSVRALKATIDELVTVPGHGVIEPLQLFYRAVLEKLHGHFFDKKQQPNMTYDTLSREVFAFEAQSMPVTTFWHKDLAKGKKWKGHTITSRVTAKDNLILTLDEGGLEEVPYSEIEWGLDEEDSGTGQGRTYAAIAAGGRPQGRGRGEGQRGQTSGDKGQSGPGVGGRGNRQAGGRGQGVKSRHGKSQVMVIVDRFSNEAFVRIVLRIECGLKAECEELGARVETLTNENMTLRTELTRLYEECKKLAADNASLKDELRYLRDDRSRSENGKGELQQQQQQQATRGNASGEMWKKTLLLRKVAAMSDNANCAAMASSADRGADGSIGRGGGVDGAGVASSSPGAGGMERGGSGRRGSRSPIRNGSNHRHHGNGTGSRRSGGQGTGSAGKSYDEDGDGYNDRSGKSPRGSTLGLNFRTGRETVAAG